MVVLLWHCQYLSSLTGFIILRSVVFVPHFYFTIRELWQVLVTIFIKLNASISYINPFSLRSILFAQIFICFLNELIGIPHLFVYQWRVSSLPINQCWMILPPCSFHQRILIVIKITEVLHISECILLSWISFLSYFVNFDSQRLLIIKHWVMFFNCFISMNKPFYLSDAFSLIFNLLFFQNSLN